MMKAGRGLKILYSKMKHEMAPNIPLPPQPVLTRCGTWLKAATYFCEHFEILKTIIMGLNKDDSTSVEKAQDLISDDNVKHSLIYIDANFGTLAYSITKIGNEIKNKFKAVLAKNTGFQTMPTISKILIDEKASNECFPDDFSADDLVHFRFDPITSVDMERSFFKYKNLLTDNRRLFTFDNIKHALIVQCNDFDF
ncbi:hypothetical protein QTP88_009115 [Uroleucon formosanum]